MVHITSFGHCEARWRVVGPRIEMESFADHSSPVTAYRVRLDGTAVDIPNGASGVVYFGEDGARPDLVLVREWFPGHWKLWDAVRAEYWDAILPLGTPRNVAEQGRRRPHRW
ncbi:hypothetical protein [Nocardia sp. CNY236]|uniref:hypothetical protein n=1 Tax=Nocardia sp. CNY236 TaxID=1169152 RepID=UPI000414D099|nr:hypothetical protein [Nocardia sp. CNY236]